MAYAGQMPRLWKLRDLQSEGGVSPGDLLVEFSQITFATVTTASLPTVFADGNVIGVWMSKVSGGTGTLVCPHTVTTGAMTITNSVTTSTDVVDVMVVGRLQV
jgi:hypothetical protein